MRRDLFFIWREFGQEFRLCFDKRRVIKMESLDEVPETCDDYDPWSSETLLVVSTYDEVKKVIAEYETATISKFTVRRVNKGVGSKGQYLYSSSFLVLEDFQVIPQLLH